MPAIPTVSHEELEHLIEIHNENNQPLMLRGATGIGKSQTAKRQASKRAEQNGREFVQYNELTNEERHEVMDNPEDYEVFIDVRLSQFDPSDLRGIPDLDNEDSVEWKPPLWVAMACQPDASGTIFLDEINHASPAVLHAAYQIVLDRQIGDNSFSDNINILAAGNREGKDAAGVQTMPGPLRNRFNHAQLATPTAEEWAQYAYDHGLDSRVAEYIVGVGSQHLMAWENVDRDAKVFATPRKWEEVASMIDGVQDREQIELILKTSVGQGVATEFLSYLDMRQVLDLEQYLEDPESVKNLDDHAREAKSANGVENDFNIVDVKTTMSAALAEKYKDDKDLLEPIVEIAANMPGQSEFGMLLLKLCKNHHPDHFTTEIVTLDSFDEIHEQVDKYLLN